MDEIGELGTDAQAMLLRFLQEGERRPVGAHLLVRVDVRVVAATHCDLEAGVERGTFREVGGAPYGRFVLTVDRLLDNGI